MDRIIMHIDVNNAFLSWTAVYLLNNGSKYDIRNSYAVIGGDEEARKGIVLAKSTPAKKLGIVTGETLYSARKKCKVLKTYPMNHAYYEEMSNKLFNLLNKYTPDIEIASIDECYLDYGKIKSTYGDEKEFAKKIQQEIYDTLGFTVNIGIANNKLCAKMASDFTKPNKIHTLYDYEVKAKMFPLPIGDLFGIGRKTVPKLEQLGINTIGDLALYDEVKLSKYFKNMAHVMIESANGINNSEVVNERLEPKGIGNEITLPIDIKGKEEAYKHLLFLSNKVGSRLRNEDKYAYVVVVIIKDDTFKRYSHQKKLKNCINTDKDIYENAKKVFNEFYNNEKIRLIGIRLDKLVTNNNYQYSIFEKEEENTNNEKLDKLIDSINNKYGKRMIKNASLITKELKK